MKADTGRFYLYFSMQVIREQWIGVVGALTPPLYYFLFLFLVFVTWQRFNSSLATFSREEALAYIGINQLLFMGFLSFGGVSRAAGDFSLWLARPRSWLAMNFCSFFAKEFVNRVFYLGLFAILLGFFRFGCQGTLRVALAALALLPILTAAQSLYNLLLANVRVIWQQASYLLLPIHKVFLVMGGILAPLHQYDQPWQGWILALPFSDLFFQPAYFCAKGGFFGMTGGAWLVRIAIHLVVLIAANIVLFRFARARHESYGG